MTLKCTVKMHTKLSFFNINCTLLFRKNLNSAFISFGSHSSKGSKEHLRHLHGTPGLAGDLGLRFSGEGPRPGLRDSHSPDLDLDVKSPAVHSECPGDFKARRKLSENGDDSRLFFLKSYNRDVFSFVPFSFNGVGVSAVIGGPTLSKLGQGDKEFCLNMFKG